MLKIYPSHPMFEIVNDLAYRMAACKNPHVFWGNAQDVPEPERLAEIADLERQFEDVEIFIKLMS